MGGKGVEGKQRWGGGFATKAFRPTEIRQGPRVEGKNSKRGKESLRIEWQANSSKVDGFFVADVDVAIPGEGIQGEKEEDQGIPTSTKLYKKKRKSPNCQVHRNCQLSSARTPARKKRRESHTRRD